MNDDMFDVDTRKNKNNEWKHKRALNCAKNFVVKRKKRSYAS